MPRPALHRNGEDAGAGRCNGCNIRTSHREWALVGSDFSAVAPLRLCRRCWRTRREAGWILSPAQRAARLRREREGRRYIEQIREQRRRAEQRVYLDPTQEDDIEF